MQPNTILNPNDPSTNPSPGDTVQSLKWAPTQANLLCAGSWDSKASIWEIDQSGNNILKAQTTLTEPVLSVSWKSDISGVILGGCDNQVKLWDLASNQTQTIGMHQAPVRDVFWIREMNMIVSGSWDSSICFWDGRQPNPVLRIPMPGRVFGMSLRYPLFVSILSDKRYASWNMLRFQQQNTEPEITTDQSLKFQIRSVECYHDARGFALGLIEGRCSMKKINLDTMKVENDFTFKCHRDNNSASALNAIAFNQAHGTFATGGSDNSFIYWDKVAKQRLKSYTSLSAPITAMDFKYDGSLFAYAVGYDWHKGIESAGSVPSKICYRPCGDDCKPKTSLGGTSAYK